MGAKRPSAPGDAPSYGNKQARRRAWDCSKELRAARHKIKWDFTSNSHWCFVNLSSPRGVAVARPTNVELACWRLYGVCRHRGGSHSLHGGSAQSLPEVDCIHSPQREGPGAHSTTRTHPGQARAGCLVEPWQCFARTVHAGFGD